MLVYSQVETQPPDGRPGGHRKAPHVSYCGFTDTANIGDYAVYVASRRLFPRLELLPGPRREPVARSAADTHDWDRCVLPLVDAMSFLADPALCRLQKSERR